MGEITALIHFSLPRTAPSGPHRCCGHLSIGSAHDLRVRGRTRGSRGSEEVGVERQNQDCVIRPH